MVKITLQNFGGEIPRRNPNYLPDNNATEASNVKLTGGTLRPMRDTGSMSEFIEQMRSVYRDSNWFVRLPYIASFAAGAMDAVRLYVTPHTAETPKVYLWGVQFPIEWQFSRLVAEPTVTGTGAVDNDLAEVVKYAYTLVSSLGEETAPSNLSVGVKFNKGRTVTVEVPSITGPKNNRTIASKRIYRSQTSAAGVTDLYFVGEVSAADSSFVDVWGVNDIQEPCPTKHFAAIPTYVRGLTAMPNGIMAAFRGRELLFCEPYQPHAWPESYRLYLDYDIVGMVASGTSLIVMTKASPYVVQGLHPDSMATAKMETILPCVSANSIVDLGTSAIYASNDGLVQISEGGAQLISQSLWSKDEWDAMTPSDIRGGRYGQSYIFSFETLTGGRRSYIVDTSDGQATITRFTLPVRFFFNKHDTNELYYVTAPSGLTIRRFDDPTAGNISFTWRSKPFRFVEPTGFSAILIEAADTSAPAQRTDLRVLADDQYVTALGDVASAAVVGQPQQLLVTVQDDNLAAQDAMTATITIGAAATEDFTIRLYADGVLVQTIQRGLNKVQRATARKARQWQVEISGTVEVARLILAQSPAEVWT